ncbi:MAG: FAD-dependent oxidoreductase [Bacteroidia bacterium]|nr:FAD-dependent oxidoreductase [Bacteroidia bacterium]
MNRRLFLKQASLVSVGGLLFPSGMFSACRKDDLFKGSAYQGKVIVVGAGAAGLYAGYLLKSKGIDFTILEAAAYHGGRMGKKSGFADYDIDTGAQWLHGRNSILGDLVAKNKVATTLDTSELSYWFNKQIVDTLPKDPFIFEGKNLPDVSFKDYAVQLGFGDEYNYIIEAIAADQGAAASQISAYWNSKDEENWVAGTEDFKFSKTYFDFIEEYIANPVQSNIVYNTPVKAIDYTNESIQLTDAGNKVWTADKVIVTVPVSILKNNEITFSPLLPATKTEAFSKFGMGAGMKVFLKFSRKFYKPVLYGGQVCAAYVDDSVGKTTNDHVLLAFVMGTQAANLHSLGSDNAITDALIKELDSIYSGQASAAFMASSVHDYTNKPFIKGAYGYSTVGMGNAREVAAQSVNDKLFFAGEAMNVSGHHQTVHGAVESGYKAVLDVLSSVKK